MAQAKGGFWVALGIATVTGFLLSLSIEAAQLFSPSRAPSLRDLLLNTVSALLGVPMGWLAASVFGPMGRTKQEELVNEHPFASLAFATVLILFFFALEPFNLTLDVGQLKEGLKASTSPSFRANAARCDSFPWPLELGYRIFAVDVGGRHIRPRSPRAWFAADCGLLGWGRALSAVFEMAQIVVSAKKIRARHQCSLG